MSITSIEHYSKAVRNGGFERLEKAIVDDYAGNNQEILGLAADQDKNAAIVYDWINHHRQEILKHKPTKGTAAEVQIKEHWSDLNKDNAGTGVLSRFYSWFRDAPRHLKGLQKGNKGASHEYAHYTYMPFSYPKGFDPKVTNLGTYFTGTSPDHYLPNTGEIATRGTQLKNYFGLKEGEKLTPEMWNYAARHYATDVADNNMTEFFLSGSNKYPYHPFFLQWLNKHAPAVGTGITITGGAAKTVNNNE